MFSSRDNKTLSILIFSFSFQHLTLCVFSSIWSRNLSKYQGRESVTEESLLVSSMLTRPCAELYDSRGQSRAYFSENLHSIWNSGYLYNFVIAV